MNQQHNNHDPREAAHRTVSRSKVVLIGFLLVIAYFLWTEHRAHIIYFLPFLLVAACLLMHFFMHGSHGHRNQQDETPKDPHAKGER
ncbi:DUF2933 domain-containing protein [Cupriavidus basilensis]|uniref:DUF2933 domain-containing protein n=1 Tax=Cupriavidus basilensis TaxID=68895 RepID=UPI0039F6FF3C